MNRLKELRQIYGLTQKELACILNVTRSAYTQYENGTRQPPLETMEYLADFYHVNLEYICGRTEYAKPISFLKEQHREIIDAMTDISVLDRQIFLYLLQRLQMLSASNETHQLAMIAESPEGFAATSFSNATPPFSIKSK